MDSVSSRDLKNQTGKILGRVRNGERITVTNRGKPVAIMVPYSEVEMLGHDRLRKYEEAWPDIEMTLAKSAPEHTTWREAIDRSRRRR